VWLFSPILLISTASWAGVYEQHTPESTSYAEPPFQTFDARPWQEPPGVELFLIDRVIDGDTFAVIEPDAASDPDPWWELVRIIGVDAPETDGPYTDEECYGPESSKYLSQLLPVGSDEYLQVDDDVSIPNERELNDEGMELEDNGRWIVHVYLRADGTDNYYLLSEILALGGYVDVKDYAENTYFVEELQDAEDNARDADRGLWGTC
jgi:endonuclease YncB( thermonuclease family)